MAKLIGLYNISRYMQCGKEKVRILIKNEGFPAIKIGRGYISDEKWIDMWIQHHANHSKPNFCSSCGHEVFA